jgi:hypothetical protein
MAEIEGDQTVPSPEQLCCDALGVALSARSDSGVPAKSVDCVVEQLKAERLVVAQQPRTSVEGPEVIVELR